MITNPFKKQETQENQENVEDLKVRKLSFPDTYYVSLIFNKMNFDISKYEKQAQELIKEARENGEEITHEKGKELIIPILVRALNDALSNYHLAYEPIRDWLASLTGKTPEEIEQMPFDTPYKILEKLAEDNDLLAFFKQAGGMKK